MLSPALLIHHPLTRHQWLPKSPTSSVRDIRFPTSRSLDGSDAMNAAPDYSAAYVVLHTDRPAGSKATA